MIEARVKKTEGVTIVLRDTPFLPPLIFFPFQLACLVPSVLLIYACPPPPLSNEFITHALAIVTVYAL